MKSKYMRRTACAALWLLSFVLFCTPVAGVGEEEVDIDSAPVVEEIVTDGEIIEPAYPVPDYVQWMLDVARGELGYAEDSQGRTKYGEWAGDPYAQWCAEFVCWTVDQVDQLHGTQHLTNTFPRYSSTNVGRDWFLKQGRYVARTGIVPDWGAQWYLGESTQMPRNSYIPQPGDWMFFSTIPSGDTTHVAMVEYCSRDDDGKVYVHVIEGNNTVAVARNTYPLDAWYILGYGTVHDVEGTTLRSGNEGKPVEELQEKLILLGYLQSQYNTGVYGSLTADAVLRFQTEEGISQTGIAGPLTHARLDECITEYYQTHVEEWVVGE